MAEEILIQEVGLPADETFIITGKLLAVFILDFETHLKRQRLLDVLHLINVIQKLVGTPVTGLVEHSQVVVLITKVAGVAGMAFIIREDRAVIVTQRGGHATLGLVQRQHVPLLTHFALRLRAVLSAILDFDVGGLENDVVGGIALQISIAQVGSLENDAVVDELEFLQHAETVLYFVGGLALETHRTSLGLEKTVFEDI